MKICSKCRQEKLLSEFYASSRSSDGRQSYCKDCSRSIRTKHYRDNPDLRRNNNFWSKYRLRPEDIARMLAEQNNKCGLCDRSFEDLEWNVDHCHKSGAVRGLLCASCNKKLGWYENRLARVAEYLDRFKSP